MSSIKITEENLWQYYEKVSEYEAACKFCSLIYIFVVQDIFLLHVREQHNEIARYEETYKGQQEWPWTCFKYNDTSTSQCLLCRKNFQSDFQSLVHHLRQKHFKTEEDFVSHGWEWKYCKRTNDFTVECSIHSDCSREYNINIHYKLNEHIISKHSGELRDARGIHDVVLSSESILKLNTIEIDKNMWQYYTKLSSCQANCRYCTYQCQYTYIERLSAHIQQEHEAVFKWEETHIKSEHQEPWMYFKYLYAYMSDKDELSIPYAKCLMCRELFVITPNCLTTHLSEKHSKEKHISTNNHWVMKYFRLEQEKKTDDTDKTKCTICYKNIFNSINPSMSGHIIKNHPKQLQRCISRKNMKKLL
nr:PREDICTED: uncharacterized protein LOC105671531 [Linepithema humile]